VDTGVGAEREGSGAEDEDPAHFIEITDCHGQCLFDFRKSAYVVWLQLRAEVSVDAVVLGRHTCLCRLTRTVSRHFVQVCNRVGTSRRGPIPAPSNAHSACGPCAAEVGDWG
jgi:hypothetical protein